MSEEPGSVVEEPSAVAARRVVGDLIEAGSITEPRARDAELHAVRIASPDGTPLGWFVALVIDERLIGFAQLDGALRLRRYSSFAGREPAARDWLDAAAVLSRARERTGPDLDLGEPFLSFDASPDRIAWLVPAIGHDGTRRRIFVAGGEVFERLD